MLIRLALESISKKIVFLIELDSFFEFLAKNRSKLKKKCSFSKKLKIYIKKIILLNFTALAAKGVN